MNSNFFSGIYRPVYAVLFIGSGLYQIHLLRGKSGTLVTILAVWLITTGLLMLLPGSLRRRLAPGFLGRSQTSALALWTALPFLGLGTALFFEGGNIPLAVTGITAGGLLAATALLLRKKALKGGL